MRSSPLTTLLIAILATTQTLAEPFTYQGQLQDAGQPANGVYDLRFELYDDEEKGTLQAPTRTLENVPVTDGLINVEIDFGNQVFVQPDLYLYVQVRDGASTGSFTGLLPRTKITHTPRAEHAVTADTVLNPQWTPTPDGISYGTGPDRVLINRTTPINTTEHFGVHSNTADLTGMFVSGPSNSLPFYGYAANGQVKAYTYARENVNGWGLFNNGSDALVVDASNNLFITGFATADFYNFTAPRTNWISVSGDAFTSASNDPYFASNSTGGAYISNTGSGWLVAPIQLPHGSVVREMRVYFDDTAAGSMLVSLHRRSHGGVGVGTVASVDTSSSFGTSLELIDTTSGTLEAVIDNRDYHYHLRVYSVDWPGNATMRIKSVRVEYTKARAD